MGSVIGYLLVEGAHDVAVIQRILWLRFQFKIIRDISILKTCLPSSPWCELVPTSWPANKDMTVRHPAPAYLQRNTDIIVIDSAGGDTQLVQKYRDIKARMETAGDAMNIPRGLGLVLDSDEVIPEARLGVLRSQLPELPGRLGVAGITPPSTPGSIPRIGVYIMPDNQNTGTLETVLLQAGQRCYPKTLRHAQTFVNQVWNDQDAWPSRREWEEISKPAGRDKATIAAITAILKPGKTTQASIADHAWVGDDTLTHTDFRHLESFLAELWSLTIPPPSA